MMSRAGLHTQHPSAMTAYVTTVAASLREGKKRIQLRPQVTHFATSNQNTADRPPRPLSSPSQSGIQMFTFINR